MSFCFLSIAFPPITHQYSPPLLILLRQSAYPNSIHSRLSPFFTKEAHLEGFEPPLMEPESIALSPELQVHNCHFTAYFRLGQ